MGYIRYLLSFGVLLSLVLLLPGNALAQFTFQRYNNIEVDEHGPMAFPWVGGLNNPQFSKADINDDGWDDLIVFDRSQYSVNTDTNGHKVLCFLNQGIADSAAYTYAPQFEQYFPPVEYFLKMVDMTCDGVPDIVTFSSSQNFFGMDVYQGYYDDTILKFTYKDFLRDSVGTFISLLKSDIPVIRDINGDGDMDVLVFDNFTNAYVNYYENRSVEFGMGCGDTMLFVLEDYCWGDFSENPVTNRIKFNDACPFKVDPYANSGPSGSPRHSGGMLMAFDEDANGYTDLIIGDISYPTMARVLGGQPDTNALMVPPVDSAFPSYDVPINIPVFPAAFYEDIDNDGQKDLMVAPNIPRQGLNYNCSWFYKDVDPSDSVHFQFQTDSFLINDMIDLGAGAYPAFFNYNGDSLMDLVVGNYGYYLDTLVYSGQLALFENVGTKATPAFKLVDRNYLDIPGLPQNPGNWLGLAPAFGDLDGDGDQDMLLGDQSGVLHAFINNDPGTGVASFSLLDTAYSMIDVGTNSVPYIYDINNDSIPDILCGRQRGELYYYENRGTRNAPFFDAAPTNAFFGQVSVAELFLQGYSAPVITTLDTTNTLYLLVGNANGRIWGYRFDRDSIHSGSFQQTFSKYSDIDVGERANFTIADITDDGKPEMIVGSFRGGLEFFTQSDSIAHVDTSLSAASEGYFDFQQKSLNIFPNPNSDHVNVQLNGINGAETAEVRILSLTGQVLNAQQIKLNRHATQQFTLDTDMLGQGLYLLSVKINGYTITRRIIKM